jgi:hypothetical protein
VHPRCREHQGLGVLHCQAHEELGQTVGHGGIMAAAAAVWQDLQEHGILPALLRGADARRSDGGSPGRAEAEAWSGSSSGNGMSRKSAQDAPSGGRLGDPRRGGSRGLGAEGYRPAVKPEGSAPPRWGTAWHMHAGQQANRVASTLSHPCCNLHMAVCGIKPSALKRAEVGIRSPVWQLYIGAIFQSWLCLATNRLLGGAERSACVYGPLPYGGLACIWTAQQK